MRLANTIKLRTWFQLGILFLVFSICRIPLVNQPILAAASVQSGTNNTDPVIKKVLDNGLTILLKPNAANEVVVVNAFVRMGALYESPTERGISKLVQRVLLKGTTTRKASDIVYQTESVGASIDATIDDYGYGSVSLKTTRDGFATSLNVFLDVLLNPSFPEGEVTKEQQMMTQQLTASTDQPTGVVFQNFLHLFYGEHPIGMQPEAIAKNVATMTRADLLAWYRKIYIPNNMVICIVGKVDPELIVKTLQETLGKMAKTAEPVQVTAALPSRRLISKLVKSEIPKQFSWASGYPAPEITSPDFPVMGVINYILGSDMGSRLFVELRDKEDWLIM